MREEEERNKKARQFMAIEAQERRRKAMRLGRLQPQRQKSLGHRRSNIGKRRRQRGSNLSNIIMVDGLDKQFILATSAEVT